MSLHDVYAGAWQQLTPDQRLSLLNGSPVTVRGKFVDPDSGTAYKSVTFPPEYAVYLWSRDPLGPYFRRLWRVELYGYYDNWWTIQSWLIDRRTVPWIECGVNLGSAGGWSRVGANNWGQVIQQGISERLGVYPQTLFYTVSHSYNSYFNNHRFYVDGYVAMPCAGTPGDLAGRVPFPLPERTCPDLAAPAWNPPTGQQGWQPPCIHPQEPTAQGADEPPLIVEGGASGWLVVGRGLRGLRRCLRGLEDSPRLR